ncbi:MAG: guanine deaminase [Enterobacteriaceae bacterium]
MSENCAGAITFCGTAFHTPSWGQLEILQDVLITVDTAGNIASLLLPDHPDYQRHKSQCAQSGQLQLLQPGQYLLPGFVDLHVHAPQWPQTGKALHLPLYEWLQNNTFPLEARYADLDFARQVYPSLVDTLLANGTTTATYFATIHHDASLLLAEVCQQKGQRALVGKVAMDDPAQCPAFYRDASASESVAGTEQFIQAVQALNQQTTALVHPVVTPRFIPTCSDQALAGLGELVQKYQCHIQTHCSESDWAHGYVQQRFGKNDTQALNDFGLLSRKTILAHANFISDADMDTLHATGSGIAHCTLSNFYFANSVFPLRYARERGLHVGLATDISGGHSPSMFDSCRFALAASRALEDGVNPSLPAGERGRSDSRIDFAEALWLATAGGGEVLDLPVGQFKPGYAWDAIVVDIHAPGSNIVSWSDIDSQQDLLQKILYNATRSNVLQTWVQGRKVYDAASQRQ